MDKGLFFLILGLTAMWLVMDEFTGKKRLTLLSELMTPDSSGGIGEVINDKVDDLKDKTKDKLTEIRDKDKNMYEIGGLEVGGLLPNLIFKGKTKEEVKKEFEKVRDQDKGLKDVGGGWQVGGWLGKFFKEKNK